MEEYIRRNRELEEFRRRHHHRYAKKLRVFVDALLPTQVFYDKRRRMFVVITETTAQKFQITVQPEQADGTPGLTDSPPTYPVDTPNIVTITPDPTGLTAWVAGAAVGTCTITPTCVAGGVTIAGAAVLVTVTAVPEGNATQLVVTLGPVVSQ